MTLANKLTEAHEGVIYNSRGVKSAQKKLNSKGKDYSQKDLKSIMEQIDFAVNANKVNGKYMDSYVETVGDDDNHIILSFHTGAMINRMEDFENLSEKYQFTLGGIVDTYPLLANILGIDYYDVKKIENYLNNDQLLDIERIKKYLKEGILVADNTGKINIGKGTSRTSQKTIQRAIAYYKYVGGKLQKYFVNPKYADKYVGIVFSPKMDEKTVKRYMAVGQRKSYQDKENRGFILDFALKIATRSYLMTVNGKPIINVDQYFNQFPEIREFIENPTNIAEVNIKVAELVGVKENTVNKLRMYSPFMSSVVAFDTNFFVEIKQGGSVVLYPREVLIFLRDIAGVANITVPETTRVGAVDYGKYLTTENNKITIKGLQTVANKDKDIQRLLFLFNRIAEKLKLYEKEIKSEKKKLLDLKTKFTNNKYYELFIYNTFVETLNKIDYVKNSWIYNPKTEQEQEVLNNLVKGEYAVAIKNNDTTTISEIENNLVEVQKWSKEDILGFKESVQEDIKNKEKYIQDVEMLIKYTNSYKDKITNDVKKANYYKVLALYDIFNELLLNTNKK